MQASSSKRPVRPERRIPSGKNECHLRTWIYAAAVEPRYVGAVSGLSLTSANIANAMGVAVSSVLFLRWLNFYGIAGVAVPPYTQWAETPGIFIRSFQSSWLVLTGLGVAAIVTSAMRGRERRKIG